MNRFASWSDVGRERRIVWMGLRPKPRLRNGAVRNARDGETKTQPISDRPSIREFGEAEASASLAAPCGSVLKPVAPGGDGTVDGTRRRAGE